MLRAIVSVLLGLTVMMPGIPMSASQWLTRYTSVNTGNAGEPQTSQVVENTTPQVHSAVETPSTTATTVAVLDAGYTSWTTKTGTSVEWKIDADGTLHVEPLNGSVGTIGDAVDYTPPWLKNGNDVKIKKVVTQGTIKLMGSQQSLFSGCSNLTDISGLSHWDTSELTSMQSIFSGCTSLSDLSPIRSWNTSKVQNMYWAFQKCGLTNANSLANWDTHTVTDMTNAFANSKLSDISGLGKWDTSAVMNMESLFAGTSITDLTPLSNWNTANVTNMEGMFSSCASLADLTPLKRWDTSKVTSIHMMFYSCPKITNVDALSNWDTSKVTDMSYMFEMYKVDSQLTNISGLQNWNTASVTNMSEMFYNCTKLTDTSAMAHWDVSKVTSFQFMFWGSSNLKMNKIGVPAGSKGGAAFVTANASFFQRVMSPFIDTPKTLPTKQTSWAKLAVNNSQGMVYVPYIVPFTVNFNANGGSGSQDPVTAIASDPNTITLPYSMFFHFGYKFTGWTTQPGAVNATSNPLMTAGSQYTRPTSQQSDDTIKYTLYAQWEAVGSSSDPSVTPGSGTLPGWTQVSESGENGSISPSEVQTTTFLNQYEPSAKKTSIVFHLTKLMDGNVPSQQFTFNLVDSSTGNIVQTVKNTAAAIEFKLNYAEADKGTHTYLIKEVEDSNNTTVKYDTAERTVTVNVQETSDGKLYATSQLSGSTVFRNTSKPATLTLKKVVPASSTDSGLHPKSNTAFTFAVTLGSPDGTPISGSHTVLINGTAKSVTFTNNVATLSLNANQTATFENLDAGTTYHIEEQNLPQGYSLQGITPSEGTLNANDTVNVTATNTYAPSPTTAMVQATKQLFHAGTTDPSTLKKGEYEFSMCEVTADGDCSGTNWNSVGTASNLADGSITFPQLNYTKTGTHTYKIKEVQTKKTGISYDSHLATVTVAVTDDGTGVLKSAVTYGDASGSADAAKPPVFTNYVWNAPGMPETGSYIIWALLAAGLLAGAYVVVMRRPRHARHSTK